MRILITGGAGFIGQMLARRLLQRGELDGRAIDRIVLADRVLAPNFGDTRIRPLAADLTDPSVMAGLIDPSVEVVFHLAAVVSGQAEADFDLGMRVNLDVSRDLLDRCRAAGHCPRVIFTSSVAVYGGDLSAGVDDATQLDPRSSYGVQKAIGELLLADYTRRGFVDGRVLRLPTICVRPGAPNKAASSFVSGLIREPLNGLEATCPVGLDLKLWLLSPGAAIDAIVAGAELRSAALGARRAVNLPGITVTVGEMIAALERVAGKAAVDLIRFVRDPAVEAIVASWPSGWDASRAEGLGLKGDADFASIIHGYQAELGLL